MQSFDPVPNAISKFKNSVIMLCWNKALWLVKLVTWLTTTNQSAFSAQHIYATLKFACDMIWRSNIISTKITFNYGSLKFAKQFYFPCWSFSAQHIYDPLILLILLIKGSFDPLVWILWFDPFDPYDPYWSLWSLLILSGVCWTIFALYLLRTSQRDLVPIQLKARLFCCNVNTV